MKRVCLSFFLTIGIGSAYANDPFSALELYGRQVASTTESGAVKYISMEKTTDKPLLAYKIIFMTDSKAMLSEPNADKDQTAYSINAARTAVWQTKFCSGQLKILMKKMGVDLVSGELQSFSGKTQRMAVCA